ncbi:hypothetical protein AUP68_11896 [Ilyonectria robusta]
MSSLSPPPTPPAELPNTVANDRFKPSVFACEWAEAYRPGGFHPVKFGDILAGGKYPSYENSAMVRFLLYGSE